MYVPFFPFLFVLSLLDHLFGRTREFNTSGRKSHEPISAHIGNIKRDVFGLLGTFVTTPLLICGIMMERKRLVHPHVCCALAISRFRLFPVPKMPFVC